MPTGDGRAASSWFVQVSGADRYTLSGQRWPAKRVAMTGEPTRHGRPASRGGNTHRSFSVTVERDDAEPGYQRVARNLQTQIGADSELTHDMDLNLMTIEHDLLPHVVGGAVFGQTKFSDGWKGLYRFESGTDPRILKGSQLELDLRGGNSNELRNPGARPLTTAPLFRP